MVVGICKMVLRIHGSYSLKDKRRVIKSVLERLKSRFNVSAAEVDKNEEWNRSVIGVACVSNDTSHIDSLLLAALNFLENDTRIELIDYFIEKTHFD